MTRKSIVAVTLFAICAFSISLVGENAKQQEKQAATPMPEMGASKEIKAMIKKVSGTWKAHTKFKMDPAATEWNESDGEAKVEVAIDSCAVIWQFTGMMMGMPFKGMNIFNYNRETKKYMSYWIDNMGGASSYWEGTLDPKTGNYEYKGADMMMGKLIYEKMVISAPDAKTVLMTIDQSADGKSYSRAMEVTYTRM